MYVVSLAERTVHLQLSRLQTPTYSQDCSVCAAVRTAALAANALHALATCAPQLVCKVRYHIIYYGKPNQAGPLPPSLPPSLSLSLSLPLSLTPSLRSVPLSPPETVSLQLPARPLKRSTVVGARSSARSCAGSCVRSVRRSALHAPPGRAHCAWRAPLASTRYTCSARHPSPELVLN